MKIYYVVYIKGEVVADCLNAILCLIKPEVKHPAHITIRGPYTQEINIEPFNTQARQIPMILDGMGRFTNPEQHVVFLACDAPQLKNIWWKPDYSFVPHLTLYNGTSQKQADEISHIANQYTYRLCLKARKLEPLIIGKERRHLRQVDFDENKISAITQGHISRETIPILSHHQRLNAIDMILQHLSHISGIYPHDIIKLTWKHWEKIIEK